MEAILVSREINCVCGGRDPGVPVAWSACGYVRKAREGMAGAILTVALSSVTNKKPRSGKAQGGTQVSNLINTQVWRWAFCDV